MASETKPQIRTDLYELDHLFGCWIRALDDLREYEQETGEEVPLVEIYAWLFLGDSVMVALDFNASEDDDEIFAVAKWYKYKPDRNGPFYLGTPLIVGESGELTHGDEWFDISWGIADDGLLYMHINDEATRYSPVDLETLVEWGFDREHLDRTIERGKSMGLIFVERFDPDGKYAQQLKEQYWRKVDEGER